MSSIVKKTHGAELAAVQAQTAQALADRWPAEQPAEGDPGPGGAERLRRLAKAGRVPCLRLADPAAAARDASEEPVLVVELRPGLGVPSEMYGSPKLYSVQDDSLLKKDERMRSAPSFDPSNLFSGRPHLVRKALSSLGEQLPSGERLRIYSDGELVAGGGPAAGQAERPGEPGVDVPALLGLVAAQLDGDGKELLAAVLRAQCGAAGDVPGMAAELREAALQRGRAAERSSPQAVEAAFARGFWSLTADYSGMRWREREAERLLERVKRELWVEGSNSRRELEDEISKFLFRYRLGRAAAEATLRLTVVRPKAAAASQEALRALGFRPSTADPACWVLLELCTLELPAA